MVTESEGVQAMLRQKEQMIRRYMDLQDQMDGLNELVYKLTCEIEALNVRIEAGRAEDATRQSLAKTAKPSEGRARRKA